MFVTNDADLYERVLTLSNHGREKSETRMFWPAVVGFKYKMSNIQAAMGCAQLLRIDELVSKRQETLTLYKKGLIPLGNLSMNPEQNGCENGAWMPNLVVSTITRIEYEDLLFACHASGIDARVFFWPLSSLPMFKTDSNMTISSSVSSRAVNLPSFFDISLEQVNHVIQTVRRLVDRRGN
jgi:perosamine synthetase